jgi:hypothetical protein
MIYEKVAINHRETSNRIAEQTIMSVATINKMIKYYEDKKTQYDICLIEKFIKDMHDIFCALNLNVEQEIWAIMHRIKDE